MEFGSKYKWFKISYLDIWNLFLKILFRFLAYNFSIFVHTFQLTLSDFFFYCYYYFNFLSKSQNQKILAKKLTNFIIQFCSKSLTHFMNLNSLDIENNMLSQHSQKPFSLYKFSSQNISVWSRKKHLHCIFSCAQALHSWRNMKAYACIFLYIFIRTFLFPIRSKVLSGWGRGWGRGWIIFLTVLAVWPPLNVLHFSF